MAAQERVRFVVTGRVQGVAFRASTRAEARRLALTGWVKNLPDGSVEAVAEGPREALEALLTWAHGGPPSARVTDLRIEWSTATGEHRGFEIGH